MKLSVSHLGLTSFVLAARRSSSCSAHFSAPVVDLLLHGLRFHIVGGLFGVILGLGLCWRVGLGLGLDLGLFWFLSEVKLREEGCFRCGVGRRTAGRAPSCDCTRLRLSLHRCAMMMAESLIQNRQ